MIRFRFLMLIILFFSSVSQLAGQNSLCSKAQMREMIQKGFSNKEIFAACNVTSKPKEEKPKKIGQSSQCTKAKMKELIQKGLSNEEIVAACNEASKPKEKEKPKEKPKRYKKHDAGFFYSTWGAGIQYGYNFTNEILLGVDLSLGDSTATTGGGSGISMKSETTFSTYNVFARYHLRDGIADGLFGQAGLALRSWNGKGSVIEDSTNAKIASIKMEWSPVVFVSGVGWHKVWGLSFSVGINASMGGSRTIEYTENMQKISDSLKKDLEEKTNFPTNLVIYIGYSF